MKRLLTLVMLCTAMLSVSAQTGMTFTLRSGVTATTNTNPLDGSTTITVPAGTDLSGLITAVKIDGTTVDASLITPNPTNTNINDGELKVFTYNNKAYGFRFIEDVWFCAVFISDCHTGQTGHDGTSASDLTAITNNIIAMGRTAFTTTPKVTFSGVEGLPSTYVPKANIVFSLGDCDADKDDHTNFIASTSTLFKDAGIPFIFIAGNHDLSPDYWTGSDPDYGVTGGSSGGANADKNTISVITSNNNYWNNQGVFDSDGALEYITDPNYSKYDFQPQHFTFKFKGVRFYCANNYWFQKSYDGSFTNLGNWNITSATYYSPDGTIDALEAFVEDHDDEPSVWMQHYPWLAGSDCNRWWLDQNDVGLYIPASNSSAYGSSTSGIAYNDANSANTLKKDPLSAIMMKTAGKVDGKVQHFSGHVHQFADHTYTSTVNSNNKVHDYTVAAPGNSSQSNNAFVVLFKRGEGVKAVVQTQF